MTGRGLNLDARDLVVRFVRAVGFDEYREDAREESHQQRLGGYPTSQLRDFIYRSTLSVGINRSEKR